MTATISRPTRDHLEELFLVRQRVDLDPQAGRELRTIAEYRRLTDLALGTASGLGPGKGVDECDPEPHPYHFNTLLARVMATAPTADTATLSNLIGVELTGSSPEDFLYYLDSLVLMALCPRVRKEGSVAPVVDVRSGIYLTSDATVTMAKRAVMGHFARRYPHIRFNITAYVRLGIHWDDLDSVGAPRISIDGYTI